MYNLYSLTKGQQAIRELARAMSDRTGNLPLMPGIYPDYRAPIVRNQPEDRELTMARWGMPSPKAALKTRNADSGVTNIRNVKSPRWRRWLGIEHRCVVPFTSFSENEALPNGSKPPVWFAFDETRPLAFFAGIWTCWTSVWKVKEGETTNDLFGFLTTEAKKEIGAIHPKAMPVILTTHQEIDLWMTAPAGDALKLQRPLAPCPPQGSARRARSRAGIRIRPHARCRERAPNPGGDDRPSVQRWRSAEVAPDSHHQEAPGPIGSPRAGGQCSEAVTARRFVRFFFELCVGCATVAGE